MEQSFEIIAKTFMGLEPVLAKELTQMGAKDVEIGRRMVSFTGDKEMMYRANFQLHTAIRILKPIRHFKAKSADDVYEEIKKIDWTEYLGTEKTFTVDSVVFSEEFRHSKFVSYKVKDAIVDQFREKTGKRPNISVANPDIRLNMHIADDKCTLSLDSSGESLHRRGYRQESVEEWPDFDAELFDAIYNDESLERDFNHKIYGYDIDMKAVNTARMNVKAAGLSDVISVEQQDFKEFTQPQNKSIMITNPPYGERISTPDLMGTYKMIGERLKHQFKGNDAWVLSYREECFDQIGLKPSIKIPLYNGSLECEFRKYQMFDGKLKDFRSEGGIVKTEEEKRQMAEKHRFKKEREFKKRLEEQEENEEADIRSFTFHRHDMEKKERSERKGRRDGKREDREERRDRKGGYKGANKGGHERFDRSGKSRSFGKGKSFTDKRKRMFEDDEE